ncbi:hypothetical protein ACFSR7_35915 [Cohnella sp. GCM10020058]|uniref:hypothetical protein n=1 Tax=Cohnella sp. GCM10020058 TaxID=3317330 RepID=UPI00364323D7
MSWENIELAREVETLAKQNGYTLSLTVENRDIGFGGALGTNEVILAEKKINITVSDEFKEVDSLWIHELLHAKLFLLGYPKIIIHPEHQQPDNIEYVLLEIENTAHHSLIYNMMKDMGVSQEELNVSYLSGVESDLEKSFSGPNNVIRALRLVEADLRSPGFNTPNEIVLQRNQPEAYSLFRKFRRSLKRIETPKQMRKAMVDNIALVDRSLSRYLGNKFYLGIFNSLPVILTDVQASRRADQVFRLVKFNEYQDIFVIGREDQHCCLFVPHIPMMDLENMMVRMTANEFLISATVNGRRR